MTNTSLIPITLHSFPKNHQHSNSSSSLLPLHPSLSNLPPPRSQSPIPQAPFFLNTSTSTKPSSSLHPHSTSISNLDASIPWPSTPSKPTTELLYLPLPSSSILSPATTPPGYHNTITILPLSSPSPSLAQPPTLDPSSTSAAGAYYLLASLLLSHRRLHPSSPSQHPQARPPSPKPSVPPPPPSSLPELQPPPIPTVGHLTSLHSQPPSSSSRRASDPLFILASPPRVFQTQLGEFNFPPMILVFSSDFFLLISFLCCPGRSIRDVTTGYSSFLCDPIHHII